MLEASVCQYQCSEEALLVWVNVGNEGASALTAGALIEVYGKKGPDETLLASQPFFGPLDPGKYAEAIGFQVGVVGYDQIVVRAVANEEECKLGNNEVAIEPPFCSPPG